MKERDLWKSVDFLDKIEVCLKEILEKISMNKKLEFSEEISNGFWIGPMVPQSGALADKSVLFAILDSTQTKSLVELIFSPNPANSSGTKNFDQVGFFFDWEFEQCMVCCLP